MSGRLGASKRRMLSLAERLPLAVLARGAADGMTGSFFFVSCNSDVRMSAQLDELAAGDLLYQQ